MLYWKIWLRIARSTVRHRLAYAIITEKNEIILLTMIIMLKQKETQKCFNVRQKLQGVRLVMITKNVKITVPLKCLSNLWRTLNMTMINCEANLILTWSENYVISSQYENRCRCSRTGRQFRKSRKKRSMLQQVSH